MPDKVKEVYDLISDKGYFTDEKEFRTYVEDSSKRKEVFSLIKDDGYFTDEKEFESYFSDVKKNALPNQKPVSQPITPPSEIGGVPTSPLIFTSPSGGEKPKTENLFEEGRLIREKRQAEYDTFKNYEFTQKKLSGIDKRLNSAEIKYTGRIVDPSLKQSLVKEKEELSKKRFDTNIDAKLAYQNVQKELDKTLEGEIKDKGLDYFTRTNESGFKTIDVDKIDQYARNLSMMSGLADEGYFKDLVYNKMKSRVDYEIAKPKIEKTFNELYAKKYGKTPQQDVEQEFKKNFVAQKQIEQQFNLQVASVAKRIKNDANLEFEQIKSTFDPEIQTINQGYQVRANEIQQAANQLNAMAQSGQIAPQEYNANITKLQADLNQLNDGYKQQFNEATTQYLNAQRELNGKYAARYKRQIYELKSMADARLRAEQEKYQKQFKVSPELQKKYTETWAEATDKFTDSEEALKTGLDELKPSAYLFGQSFVSGLGNAIRSLSTSIGYDEGRVIGDYLANMYTLSNPEIKEAKDLLDMTKVLRSSGEMIGGMAPMIAGQTITALATGGLSIPTQLAVQGGLGFTLETAQIGGSMYDETFARTGSANEAEKAATSVMKNNLYLLPLYAVDGLPFIEKATLGVKSTALRGVVKGAVETGTEIPQEFFQSAFEDLARSNKEIKDLGEFITLDRLKNTALNVIPSTFALGATPTYISSIKNKWTEIEAKSLAAKQDLSRLSGTAMQQYMYDMYLRYGENFSKAYLSGLYQSNKIDEAQTAELTKTLDSAKQVLENSNKFKLNKGESKIYASLLFGYEKARAESEAATDDVVKQALTQTANQFKNIASNYLSSKKADFAVIVLPNNEQYVVTLQEANDMLNDESFAAKVRAGEVNISPQSTEKTEEFNSLTNRLKNIADESLRPTDEGRVTTTEERIGEPLESGKGEPTQEDVFIGEKIDDTKDKAGLPSEVGIRQEPIQAEPIQEAGISEIAPSGVLETDEKVTPQAGSVVGGEVKLPNYGKTVDTKMGKVDLVIEPNTQSENKNSIKVSAYDVDGNTLGFSSAVIDAKNKTLTVKVSQIKDKYQRNGIYSKIIDEYEAIAKDKGLKFEREIEGETQASKDFWSNREQSLQSTPQAEEAVSETKPQLEPEIKSNLEKIQEETGVNFREIQNVYTKYGEGKPLNEITVEDYRRAEAKRQAEKAEPELDVSEVQTIAEKVIQARDTKRGYDKQGGRPKPTDMKSQREQKAQAILQDIDTQSVEYQNVKAVEENIEDIINDLMNNGSIESTDCVL